MNDYTFDKELTQDAKDIIFRFDSGLEEGTNCFHLNYESGRYREDELASLIRDTIPSFALTHEEYIQYANERTLSRVNSKAINRISRAKKNAKGDYGELLLFLLLDVFENAPKFVTKVRLRSTKKDQIKGFDCAHFTVDNNDNVTLWLGEAKFHASIHKAVNDAIESLNDHINDGYIRDEIDILHDNLEINADIEKRYYDLLAPYLRKSKSLDNVAINIPVLLTYDSNAISKSSNHISSDFIEKLNKELRRISTSQLKGKSWPTHNSVSISFYLFPLKSVATIKARLEKIEDALR